MCIFMRSKILQKRKNIPYVTSQRWLQEHAPVINFPSRSHKTFATSLGLDGGKNRVIISIWDWTELLHTLPRDGDQEGTGVLEQYIDRLRTTEVQLSMWGNDN